MKFNQWCVTFTDGSAKTIVAPNKEAIIRRYRNIRSIFRVGVLK